MLVVNNRRLKIWIPSRSQILTGRRSLCLPPRGTEGYTLIKTGRHNNDPRTSLFILGLNINKVNGSFVISMMCCCQSIVCDEGIGSVTVNVKDSQL